MRRRGGVRITFWHDQQGLSLPDLFSAISAIENRISKPSYDRPPFAFPHSTVLRITNAVREGFYECLPQKLRINLPVSLSIVMTAQNRAIRIIIRVKDKNRFRAVKLVHGRQIKAFDFRFSFAFQRMMNH